MNIEVSARHFDLTEGLRQHVIDRLSGLDRFYDGIDDIHVILEVTSGTNHSHIQMLGDRLNINARAKSHDMYAAFDEAHANVERQLRRFKEKIHRHPHRTGSNGAQRPASGSGGTQFRRVLFPAESSGLGSVSVDVPDSELPRFTTSDAMLEFEVSGSDYLVFFNKETDRLSAVYRTGSGQSQVVELLAEK
ncbi:ribosome-associated translation inhibitor RaiA [Candidatus Fermentibacterales bacterium]|nr:ribosome-associated translation inhibitor RaiA [Candidatus Fermentibacterales bacterium]